MTVSMYNSIVSRNLREMNPDFAGFFSPLSIDEFKNAAQLASGRSAGWGLAQGDFAAEREKFLENPIDSRSALYSVGVGKGKAALQEILKNKLTSGQVYDLLRKTNHGVQFRQEDLTNEVTFDYFSEGDFKYVYKVVFRTKEGVELPVALSIGKREQYFTQREIDFQMQAEKARILVPRSGAEVTLDNGNTAVLEEFITGMTLFA